MRIIVNKNKTKIKSFNVSPTDDGFELKMVVKDDDVAQNISDVFNKVQIEFGDDEDFLPKTTVKQKDTPTEKEPEPIQAKEEPKKDKYVIEEQSVAQRKQKSSYNLDNFREEDEDASFFQRGQGVKKTILIIEDDDMINKVVANKLKKNEYTIVTAKDGDDGIDKIMEFLPDLIITDVMMPFTSGMEVIEYVRKKMKLKTPIIVLSSLEDEETILRAFKVGADDYLTKPFGPEELFIRVKRLLMIADNASKTLSQQRI